MVSVRKALTGAAAIAVGVAGLAACSSSSASTTPTLHYFIFKDNSGAFQSGINNCNKLANGAYRIEYDLLPPAADDQRQQLVRRLAAHDSALDILGMDVVWAPEFAEAGWVREWTGSVKDQVMAGTLSTAIQTGSWKGKLYAAPLNSNTQLLWYRKDLVPNPPTTWDQMIQDAITLGQQGKPGRVEIQGAQYEGLTVWFNTMVNSARGNILSPDGKQVVLDQAAETALTEMRKLATSPAADTSLSVQKEDDNRLAFESNTAAFELNYPFVYPSAVKNKPDLAKNMGWTQFPSVVPGQPSKVTIGGIDLGVSTYSKHPNEAFQAAACLRNPDNQKVNAVTGGLPPTLISLYSDPSVQQQYPFASDILTALQNASVRPQSPAYTSVSAVISYDLSPPGSINPTRTINRLRSGMRDALNSKGLIP
jgi:multiple sugar transport system substrate-binding protein